MFMPFYTDLVLSRILFYGSDYKCKNTFIFLLAQHFCFTSVFHLFMLYLSRINLDYELVLLCTILSYRKETYVNNLILG